MQRDRLKRIYDLHAWSGIALGLFVFIVSLTGCFALFDHEIHTWEDPALRLELPESPSPIHDTFSRWVIEKAGRDEVRFVSLQFPSRYSPFYTSRVSVAGDSGDSVAHTQRWNAETLEPIPERGEGLSVWLLDIHRDLMWPGFLGGATIGRTLVGIAGIILMLSIVSGVVTHRKILQEFFTLRVNRSLRLRWKDAHNLLGIWTLPFSLMIAFTGAFLGVIALLVPLTGALVAKGDTGKLREVISPAVLKVNVTQPMYSLDAIGSTHHPKTGNSPGSVSIVNWGDESAVYQVFYPSSGELSRNDIIDYSGVSGKQLEVRPFVARTFSNRVIGALTPLHYGTYGGISLKALYFVLGILLCSMVAFGIMVWVERRANGVTGEKNAEYYWRIGRFSAGMMLGLFVASIFIFYVDKLYFGNESARLFWVGLSYFLVWLFTLCITLQKRNTQNVIQTMLLLCSLGLLGLPIVNGLTASWLFKPDVFAGFYSTAGVVFGVDVGLVLTGIAVLVVNALLSKMKRYA